MSADGDLVRAALETDDASFGHPDAITEDALAALARLEAAEEQRLTFPALEEALARLTAQRDTLAEALRDVLALHPAERAAARAIARAALAEAGL